MNIVITVCLPLSSQDAVIRQYFQPLSRVKSDANIADTLVVLCSLTYLLTY